LFIDYRCRVVSAARLLRKIYSVLAPNGSNSNALMFTFLLLTIAETDYRPNAQTINPSITRVV